MADDEKLARRRERERLLSFLKRGGVLMAEDVGGSVGTHWGPAHRNGSPFDGAACSRLVEKGFRHEGQRYELTAYVKPNMYVALEVAE